MEQQTLKEFLNNQCQIFDFSLSDLSMYLIIFNINHLSVLKMTEYFKEGEIKLNITKDEEDFNYVFHNLSEKDLDFSSNPDDYGQEINKLCRQFLTNNAYLVNVGDKFFIIFDWNVMQNLIENENKTKILAVFLNNKDKFLEIVNENSELTLIKFKKEEVENVSQLFDEEELQESKENFNEDLKEDEAENFDKEFELDADELEEDTKPKNKKIKKNKRKKSEEYDVELDSKDYMGGKGKRRRREEVDENKYVSNVRKKL